MNCFAAETCPLRLASRPLEHTGNMNALEVEAHPVSEMIPKLLAALAHWVKRQDVLKRLTPEHLLVVVSYNAQDATLRAMLRDGGRISALHNYRGQETPNAVFSMATSAADQAAR